MGNSASKSGAEQLVPFTGYYTLDKGGGAFLLVDTNFTYNNAGGEPTITHTATVTISMDGKSSSIYPIIEGPPEGSEIILLEPYGTFDDGTLLVYSEGSPIAAVELVKDHSNGNSSALGGVIQGHPVAGATPFNPVPLPVFAASYFDPLAADQPRLEIKADKSVWYDEGGGLVQVNDYTYNYAMFVIGFELKVEGEGEVEVEEEVEMEVDGEVKVKVEVEVEVEVEGKEKEKTKGYEFEMGTSKGLGRVAGNAAKGGLLVSILPWNTTPPMTP